MKSASPWCVGKNGSANEKNAPHDCPARSSPAGFSTGFSTIRPCARPWPSPSAMRITVGSPPPSSLTSSSSSPRSFAGRSFSGSRASTSATPGSPALFIIGMFYNQFLPGGTGGDIVKTYLLWKETPGKKPGGLLAVLFDRMIGLIALIIITGILIFLRYDWLTSTKETAPYVWLVLAIFGSVRSFRRHDVHHQHLQSARQTSASFSWPGKAD